MLTDRRKMFQDAEETAGARNIHTGDDQPGEIAGDTKSRCLTLNL